MSYAHKSHNMRINQFHKIFKATQGMKGYVKYLRKCKLCPVGWTEGSLKFYNSLSD